MNNVLKFSMTLDLCYGSCVHDTYLGSRGRTFRGRSAFHYSPHTTASATRVSGIFVIGAPVQPAATYGCDKPSVFEGYD